MLAHELDFELPPELIAQSPARPRDSARLLHWQRENQQVTHRSIADLPQILREGDLLVVNDSRVLRARLIGAKFPSGGRIEILLLREEKRNVWQCLVKPAARLHPGDVIRFATIVEPHSLEARALYRQDEGWVLEFRPPEGYLDVRQVLGMFGEVPVPPYIRSRAEESDYQTVYARHSGPNSEPEAEDAALDSVAAPTAGLHFTPQLLENLRAKNIDCVSVTLGVGMGTFRPVQVENLADHAMHAEDFWISQSTAERIALQKASGKRVVAVGTTSARALEAASSQTGRVQSGAATTKIFIQPGFAFQTVDALLTNFHLPRSTLLALVAAFVENNSGSSPNAQSGITHLHRVYREAIERRYRFFSFGDAMLIE